MTGPAQASPHPLGLKPDIPYGQLSSEVVTPHIPWGRPLAAGSIRGLVMAPTWSHRETVELAQRLDFEFVYLLTLIHILTLGAALLRLDKVPPAIW